MDMAEIRRLHMQSGSEGILQEIRSRSREHEIETDRKSQENVRWVSVDKARVRAGLILNARN